jgi:hypothetical protein
MKLKTLLTLLLLIIIADVVYAKFTDGKPPWVSELREPDAVLTPFSNPEDYFDVEDESEGPGWRYFYRNAPNKKVIIYNHPWSGVWKEYPRHAKSHDFEIIADWFSDQNVNFYAALRKDNDTKSLNFSGIKKDKIYGLTVEPLEVFHHLTKLVKKKHGNDAIICYSGHSAGGPSALFTSAYLNQESQRHVSISPENSMGSNIHQLYRDWSFLDEHYKKSKNLTIIIGANELKTPKEGAHDNHIWHMNNHPDSDKRARSKIYYKKRLKHTKMFYAALKKIENENIKVFKTREDFDHQQMSEHYWVEQWGKYIVQACGF